MSPVEVISGEVMVKGPILEHVIDDAGGAAMVPIAILPRRRALMRELGLKLAAFSLRGRPGPGGPFLVALRHCAVTCRPRRRGGC